MERLLQLFVAGGDGPMLLEPVDQPFDLIAFTVGGPIEADPTPGLGFEAGNDRADPPPAQVRPDRPARIPLVTDDALRSDARPVAVRPLDGPAFQQRGDLGRLVALAGGQDEADRLAAPFGAEMDFGREAAAGAAEGLVAAPFFAPAALWCARIVVPSRKCKTQSRSPAASASACSAASARSQTPARCQRRKREYTVFQGPKRSGRSRQGAPVAKRQRMPSTTIRSSARGRPRPLGGGGSSGRSRSHWASVSVCRSMNHSVTHIADTP
jgi:hypothetical protein